MQSEDKPIPTFGLLKADASYTARSAAYVVITDQQGSVAVVKSKDHYFLPGGGSLREETPEETVRREVKEELAREICIVSQIGTAIQYFHADGQDYRMEAVFFAGKLGDEVIGTGEHELCWLQIGQIEEGFYHESHAWAIREQRS